MTFQDTPANRIAMAEAAAAAAASTGAAPHPATSTRTARFLGETQEFWRIQARGAVLLALTLGIYRFWLATDVRRFLWSNTEIAGDSLEYNGTANELLIGFLIAVALLVPLNLVVFLLAMSAVGEGASVIGFMLLFVLGQYAIFRARRYRLTRTVLRGVRCHQSGSAVRYACCATFWWIVVISTLGLAYPFAQASLERYKLRHTHYGDLSGRFEGSGFRLFFRGILMWVVTVVPFVIGIFFAVLTTDWDVVGRVIAEGAISSVQAAELGGSAALALSGAVLSVVVAVLLFPIFQAMMLRWWLDGIRFGELSVRSNLLRRRIYSSYVRFLWYSGLFSLAAGAVGLAGFVAFGFLSASLGGFAEIAGVAAAVFFYVVMMLGFSAIYQTVVRLTYWRHAVETAELSNVEVLGRVKATGRPGSPVGEGLADALNVGGI